MNLEIKLKAGFFKTQDYCLTLEAERIILNPRDDMERERLVIEEKELKSFSIITRNYDSGELEIITDNNIYTGSFSSCADWEELFRGLDQEFGDKFIFRHGNG